MVYDHYFFLLLNHLVIISYMGMRNDNTCFIFKSYCIVMLVNFMKIKIYTSNLLVYLKQFLTSLGSQPEFMSKEYKVSFGLKTMIVFVYFVLIFVVVFHLILEKNNQFTWSSK